jgi:hypothetical protein
VNLAPRLEDLDSGENTYCVAVEVVTGTPLQNECGPAGKGAVNELDPVIWLWQHKSATAKAFGSEGPDFSGPGRRSPRGRSVEGAD